MNICMLSQTFLPTVGGLEQHVYELSKALVRHGCNVRVVTTEIISAVRALKVRSFIKDGIHVLMVPIGRIPKTMNLQYKLRVGLYLRHLVDRYNVQIIHWHGIGLDCQAIRLVNSVPLIFTNHTSFFVQHAQDSNSRAMLRERIAPAEMIICPSRELVELTKLVGLPAQKVVYIPNGVDIDRFRPDLSGENIRLRYGLEQEDVVVLCPRRFAKKNGIIYLVRAIPHILRKVSVRVKFMLVGGYASRDQYDGTAEILSTISELGLGKHVILTGFVDNSEMPLYYAASDIVVLPSLVEATSIAGLEAMASAKPLVGTTVGGIPEIVVNGENGILVPPADPNTLAQALATLILSPEMRIKMGIVGRERAQRHFSWDHIAYKTLEVYEAALAKL